MGDAIIGTGFAAGTHAKNLAAMGRSISVVVDRVDAGAAKAFAKRWRAAKSSDRLEDAFAPDVEFVHICSVPACHYEETKAALLAGKNVICEKPLCLDPAEAEELARMAKERGLINAVCFNIRFYDACEKMRARLRGCGVLCTITGKYFQEFHALPCEYAWRYDEKAAGPMRAVTEIGSHWFDMLRYVTGEEVVSVSAQFGNFTPERKLENGVMCAPDGTGKTVRVNSDDTALVTFRLSGGAIGSAALSEIFHGMTNSVTLELCGRKSTMWWDSEDPYKLWSGKKGRGASVEMDSFADGFDSTFRNMFSSVYSGSSRYATFEDGARNAEICAAIFRSARSGGIPVSVQDEKQEPGGMDALKIVNRLGLSRLPAEGTFYRQTYRSRETLKNGDPAGTAVIGLYSADPPSFSRFHRLDRWELWHFYMGDPFELILLYPDGSHRVVVMGTDIAGGQLVQFDVPANVWQAARLVPGGRTALYGCTLAPGFVPECFEAGTADMLLPKYPDMERCIKELAAERHEAMPRDVDD